MTDKETLARLVGAAIAKAYAQHLGCSVHEAMLRIDSNIVLHGAVAAVTFEDMVAASEDHARLADAAWQGVQDVGLDLARWMDGEQLP